MVFEAIYEPSVLRKVFSPYQLAAGGFIQLKTGPGFVHSVTWDLNPALGEAISMYDVIVGFGNRFFYMDGAGVAGRRMQGCAILDIACNTGIKILTVGTPSVTITYA